MKGERRGGLEAKVAGPETEMYATPATCISKHAYSPLLSPFSFSRGGFHRECHQGGNLEAFSFSNAVIRRKKSRHKQPVPIPRPRLFKYARPMEERAGKVGYAKARSRFVQRDRRRRIRNQNPQPRRFCFTPHSCGRQSHRPAEEHSCRPGHSSQARSWPLSSAGVQLSSEALAKS